MPRAILRQLSNTVSTTKTVFLLEELCAEILLIQKVVASIERKVTDNIDGDPSESMMQVDGIALLDAFLHALADLAIVRYQPMRTGEQI